MIDIKNVTKKFNGYTALDGLDLSVSDGIVYGLLGTNGAGKSTLLRIIAGVIKPDEGMALINDENVYDNPNAKKKLFYISDEQYFFNNSTGCDMAKYLSSVYENFDMEGFKNITEKLSLDGNRKINTFSKGMKKQMAIVLGLCAKTEYLLCDETFDGLDPVMRQAVKSLFAKELAERKFSVIIASHNLRELEDICDTIGLLHKGGVLMSKDLDDAKSSIQKVQCVFANDDEYKKFTDMCKVKTERISGALHTLTVDGTKEEVTELLRNIDTVYCEIIPVSLEELFISETEGVGYDIKKLIMEEQ